ncbi:MULTISPECIES: hypothetical protein [Mycobacterium]|uniref:hypothetical protein n=1 Tax=Mycobacterium TaxID=1763 RepID=UPI0013C48432|nr:MULTISPECIES: hypothetical protein [Mycobacterium]QNI09773.1 hypothetical protein GAN17_25620 [Mycobacterium kubicae]
MADIGHLGRCTTGGWILIAPQRCGNGHALAAYQVLVGHTVCSCPGGHTSWTCRTCGHTTHAPTLSEDCQPLNGPC